MFTKPQRHSTVTARDPERLKLRKIKNAIPISERPPEVEDRAVPGHWQGDLIVGSNNSYIATLVERHSRLVMLAKVENKDTQSVVAALIRQARKFPKELYRSLIWDQGSEMAGHVAFTMATKVDVYFVIRSPPSLDILPKQTPAGQCIATGTIPNFVLWRGNSEMRKPKNELRQ